MAEFQEMVRELHRLCETQRRLNKNTCNKCPIKIATMGTMFQCYRYVLEKPKEAENIIMSWVADHPEPVYPTWWKFLCMIGVIPSELGDKTLGEATVYNLMNTRIQSDIAEKLDIEKERV